MNKIKNKKKETKKKNILIIRNRQSKLTQRNIETKKQKRRRRNKETKKQKKKKKQIHKRTKLKQTNRPTQWLMNKVEIIHLSIVSENELFQHFNDKALFIAILSHVHCEVLTN